MGIISKSDLSKGLECYVNAESSRGWKYGDHVAPESVLSRTCYGIIYAACSITSGSGKWTTIALNTTGSEYIALSTDMRKEIPFIKLTAEIASMFGLLTLKPIFKYKVWEDNDSFITVAKAHRFAPRKKHISIKYHRFWSFVLDGTSVVNPIDTPEQFAVMLTKSLNSYTGSDAYMCQNYCSIVV